MIQPVKTEPQYRRLTGVVVSDKMPQTRVVRVEIVKIHPKYKKRFVVSKRFAVDDAKNISKLGDKVEIEACAPRSRTKRFRILNKV